MIEFMDRKALPCPFCGCRDVLAYTRKFVEENYLRLVQIRCGNIKDCGVTVWGNCVPGDYDEGYEKALKIWNRRAEP